MNTFGSLENLMKYACTNRTAWLHRRHSDGPFSDPPVPLSDMGLLANGPHRRRAILAEGSHGSLVCEFSRLLAPRLPLHRPALAPFLPSLGHMARFAQL